MKKLVAGVLLLLSVVPVHSGADAVDLATGIRQVADKDYRAALVTLDGVVRHLGGDTAHQKDRALAHLYRGAAYLGLEQKDKAEAEMREAARLDPTLAPDPQSLSPAAVALFDSARHSAAKSSKSSKTVPIVIAGGAAIAGGVALAASGGKDAESPATQPVVVAPPTTVPVTVPPSTTAPRSGTEASAFGVYLLGAGTSTHREVHVGSGTLVARFEGYGSEVQVIVNDPTGTNVAVDTNFTDVCSISDTLKVEARVPVTPGTYSVVVKVGQDIKAACCRLKKCSCASQKSPSCFFANGQLSVFYPAP
jgi:hypothetical protein